MSEDASPRLPVGVHREQDIQPGKLGSDGVGICTQNNRNRAAGRSKCSFRRLPHEAFAFTIPHKLLGRPQPPGAARRRQDKPDAA